MRPILPAIRHAGAELVGVGPGKLHHLQWFIEDQKPDFPIFTDPTGRVYELAEMEHGVWSSITPRGALAFARAFAAGYRQEGVRGDPNQQGGILIVRPGGEVAWAHVSRHAGDFPAPDEVLAGLAQAEGE